METLETIEFTDFLKVGMYTGTILAVELNPKARVPAYKLRIDFGAAIGEKTSSAQVTANYSAVELVGKQIIAVVNFEPKRVAGIKSEVLVLAAVCDIKGTVLLEPTQPVENGTRIM